MQFEIKLDQAKFQAFDTAMKKAPGQLIRAIARGLTTGLNETAGAVKQRVGGSSLLKRRSGHLTDAIKAYKDNPLDLFGYIGVGDDQDVAPYAWLLGEREPKTINAKAGKLLAIPIAAGLTDKGVARYNSPRDVPDGFWFKSKAGNVLFGRSVGKGQLELLFVGKESVTIESSGILPDVIQERIPKMAQAIEKEVIKTIAKLGLN